MTATPAPGSVERGDGARRPRWLHLHSSFNPGGKELRAVRLMNAFGAEAEHVVVSAQPGALGAMALIADGVVASADAHFPALQGPPKPARLRRIAAAMAGYDLVLTYNFGAMDAVMAHRLFGRGLGLPPLVHHEDGFNEDEVLRRSPLRNLYRRIGLARAAAVVVCSRVLEGIARAEWHQPPSRLRRIPNGIPLAGLRDERAPAIIPGLAKQSGDLWVGTLAGLRAVKNLPLLVRAFAALPAPWQLVICGQGPEAAAIRAEAARLGIADRVHLPGQVGDPARVAALFDIFALSSDSEQFPISVVEAMAAGAPVAATDVGDVRGIVAQENHAFLAAPGDEAALAGALAALAGDAALRARVGAANRAKALAEYDEAAMIAAYRAVYRGAAVHGTPQAGAARLPIGR